MSSMPPPVQLTPASYGLRIASFVLDGAIPAACLAIPGLIAWSMVEPSTKCTSCDEGLQTGFTMLGSSVAFLVALVVGGIVWGAWLNLKLKQSSTPAMALLKLRVVDASVGAPVTMETMKRRLVIVAIKDMVTVSLVFNAPSPLTIAVFVVVNLVFGIFIVVSDKRQGVPDLICKTMVVRAT